MAINQKGAVIPYQPTYSIQYKYGDRYGPQSFASPTTALGAAGQAGGPLSSQATLDQTTEETANPVVSAEGGDGETLDSKAEGAPGGTGGADFSQFRNQYTPVQPDFGWQYSSTYGDDEYRDPSVSGIFNPPEVPPESGFGSGIIDSGDGGDDGSGVTELSPEVNSPTGEYVGFDLLDDIQNINNPDNLGVGNQPGNDLGGGTGAGYTNVGGDGYGTEGTDPTSQDAYGGIDGAADAAAAAEAAAQAAEEENNASNMGDSDGGGDDGGGGSGGGGSGGGGGQGDSSEHGGTYDGALMMPIGIPKRPRDNRSNVNYSQGIPNKQYGSISQMQMRKIPNPLLQDPLADLFRRA